MASNASCVAQRFRLQTRVAHLLAPRIVRCLTRSVCCVVYSTATCARSAKAGIELELRWYFQERDSRVLGWRRDPVGCAALPPRLSAPSPHWRTLGSESYPRERQTPE